MLCYALTRYRYMIPDTAIDPPRCPHSHCGGVQRRRVSRGLNVVFKILCSVIQPRQLGEVAGSKPQLLIKLANHESTFASATMMPLQANFVYSQHVIWTMSYKAYLPTKCKKYLASSLYYLVISLMLYVFLTVVGSFQHTK